jgi:phosphatidylglycerophosphate synthase
VTQLDRTAILIVADDAQQALSELCGISLLERHLRILQRLGVREATIVAREPHAIAAHLDPPSWARAALRTTIHDGDAEPSAGGRTLVLPAGIFCDSRLLAALLQREQSTAIIDSSPPAAVLPLLDRVARCGRGFVCGPALIDDATRFDFRAPLEQQIAQAVDGGALEILDVETQPTYIVGTRRHVRPIWFPAPRAEHRPAAEKLILNAAQKGTLDLPARVHGPIETWLIARLCRTSITPNQLTLATMLVSLTVTAQYATGHLASGAVTALAVGVLDGLDGKQARVKVETTEAGEWEHELDYVLETSWWVALAWHFYATALGPLAFQLVGAFIALDLLDRAGRGLVKRKIGRDLDDATRFDQAVRLVAARRNVFTWMFAAALLVSRPAEGFVAMCGWGIVTALVHLTREIWILAPSGRKNI